MRTLLIKTEEGQQAFKARSAQLAGKLRSAYLLFDGQRTVQDVLRATQGLGVTQQDIDAMLQAGLLQKAMPTTLQLTPAAQPSTRTAQERYRDAYPLAVELTGHLGLKGFRLNFSVEGATNYEELLTVVPQIKEAVGPQACASLEHALFG